AVIRQVHFAYRPSRGGFESGHSNYAVRVSRDGALHFQPDGVAPLTLGPAIIRRGDRPLPARGLRVARDGSLERDLMEATEKLINTERGVEQSWSFSRPPQGSGDLVVRLAVSGLTYAAEAESGVLFRDRAGPAGVKYSPATWIDRAG